EIDLDAREPRRSGRRRYCLEIGVGVRVGIAFLGVVVRLRLRLRHRLLRLDEHTHLPGVAAASAAFREVVEEGVGARPDGSGHTEGEEQGERGGHGYELAVAGAPPARSARTSTSRMAAAKMNATSPIGK